MKVGAIPLKWIVGTSLNAPWIPMNLTISLILRPFNRIFRRPLPYAQMTSITFLFR